MGGMALHVTRMMMLHHSLIVAGFFSMDMSALGANHWRVTEYAGIVPRMDYLFRTSATPHLVEFLDHEHRLVSFRERSWLYDSLLFGNIENNSALKQFPDLLSNAIDYPRNRSGNGITPLSTSSIFLAQKDVAVEDVVDLVTPLSSKEETAVPICTPRNSYSMHLYMHLKGVAAALVGNLTLSPEYDLAKAAWTFVKHAGQRGARKHSTKDSTVTVTNDEMGARISKELARDSHGSWALFNLAAVFWRVRGNVSQAVTCLQHAIVMAPHDYRDVGMVQLGNLLYRAERFKDAQILVEAALLTTNEEARRAYGTQYLHGNILTAQGFTAEAYRAYQRAVTLQPELKAALQMFRQATEDMKRQAARARRKYEINLRKVTMVLPPTMTWHDFEYELPDEPCAGVVCGEHAECEPVDQKCHCTEGWLAATTTGKCIRDTKCVHTTVSNLPPSPTCGPDEICRGGRCYCKPGFRRRVYKSTISAANISSEHSATRHGSGVGKNTSMPHTSKGPCMSDLCARASCIDRATCNPTTGRCECQSPYVQVGAHCMDVACRSVACRENAICHLGKCYCAIGFRVAEEDKNRTMCVPDPPCTNTKCPEHSACNMTDSHCRCLPGYVADVSKNACVIPQNSTEATMASPGTTLHNVSVLPSTVLVNKNSAEDCPPNTPECHVSSAGEAPTTRLLAPPTNTKTPPQPSSASVDTPPDRPRKRTVRGEGKADDATYSLLLRANDCESHKRTALDWVKQGYVINPPKCFPTATLDAIDFVGLDEFARAIVDTGVSVGANIPVQLPYCIRPNSKAQPWRMSTMDHLQLFSAVRTLALNNEVEDLYTSWKDVVSIRRVLSTMLNTAVAKETSYGLRARSKYVGLYNRTRELDVLSSAVQPLAGHVLATTLARNAAEADTSAPDVPAVQLLAAQWWLGNGNVSAALDCARAVLHNSGRASASKMADMVPPLLVLVQISLRVGHTDDLDTLADVAKALSEARQDSDTSVGEKRSMMVTAAQILADAIHGRPERAISQLQPLIRRQERLAETAVRPNLAHDFRAVAVPLAKLSKSLECAQLQKILAQTEDFSFTAHLATLEQLLAAQQRNQDTVHALEEKYNNVLAETGEYEHASVELETARHTLRLIAERVMEEMRVLRNIETHLPHLVPDAEHGAGSASTDGAKERDLEELDLASDHGVVPEQDPVTERDVAPSPMPVQAPNPRVEVGTGVVDQPHVAAMSEADAASIQRSVSSLMASVADLLELEDDEDYGEQDSSVGSETDSTTRIWLAPTWPSSLDDCAVERDLFPARQTSLVPADIGLELTHVFQTREAQTEFKALLAPLSTTKDAWATPQCSWTPRMQERWGQHPPPLKQLSKVKALTKGGAKLLDLTPSNQLVPLLQRNFQQTSRSDIPALSLAEAGERIRVALEKSKDPWSLLHLASLYWQIHGVADKVRWGPLACIRVIMRPDGSNCVHMRGARECLCSEPVLTSTADSLCPLAVSSTSFSCRLTLLIIHRVWAAVLEYTVNFFAATCPLPPHAYNDFLCVFGDPNRTLQTLACLKLACHTAPAPKDMSLLVLSDLLLHVGDATDAVTLATKAIRLNVRAAHSHYHLAKVLTVLYVADLEHDDVNSHPAAWDRSTLLTQAVFFYKTAALLDKQRDDYAAQYRLTRCWEAGFLSSTAQPGE
eukprot:m.1423232 g.1423232  ORF g.1423232 m.1423232 type:complete len:1670 (-) comp25056_c0_seq2:757-5766(-)